MLELIIGKIESSLLVDSIRLVSTHALHVHSPDPEVAAYKDHSSGSISLNPMDPIQHAMSCASPFGTCSSRNVLIVGDIPQRAGATRVLGSLLRQWMRRYGV